MASKAPETPPTSFNTSKALNKFEKFTPTSLPLQFETKQKFERALKAHDDIRNNLIVKGEQFFSGNDNRWNNATLASEKYYKFYHKHNDEFLPLIEALTIEEKVMKRQTEFESLRERADHYRAKI